MRSVLVLGKHQITDREERVNLELGPEAQSPGKIFAGSRTRWRCQGHVFYGQVIDDLVMQIFAEAGGTGSGIAAKYVFELRAWQKNGGILHGESN